MGFWKELGKAVSHTIDEDIKRTRRASEKEAEARRLMDEAASLRRQSIFTIDTPSYSGRGSLQIERQIAESESRERECQMKRLAAEGRFDYSMVRRYREIESREMEFRAQLRRELNRARGY